MKKRIKEKKYTSNFSTYTLHTQTINLSNLASELLSCYCIGCRYFEVDHHTLLRIYLLARELLLEKRSDNIMRLVKILKDDYSCHNWKLAAKINVDYTLKYNIITSNQIGMFSRKLLKICKLQARKQDSSSVAEMPAIKKSIKSILARYEYERVQMSEKFKFPYKIENPRDNK